MTHSYISTCTQTHIYKFSMLKQIHITRKDCKKMVYPAEFLASMPFGIHIKLSKSRCNEHKNLRNIVKIVFISD